MTKKAEIPAVSTLADLATLWNVPPRRVEFLAKSKIAHRVGHGRYGTARSTANYIAYLVERARAPGVPDEADLTSATVALRREQARKAKLANDTAAGRLVDYADVLAVQAAVVRRFKTLIERLPDDARHNFPTMSAGDHELFKRMVDEALFDASIPDEWSDETRAKEHLRVFEPKEYRRLYESPPVPSSPPAPSLGKLYDRDPKESWGQGAPGYKPPHIDDDAFEPVPETPASRGRN